MCGTANHKSEYGHHGHYRVPAADTAAYEYLAKGTTADTKLQQTTATTVPAPATAERKKPLDSLSVLTAVTKSAVDKCSSFFGEVQKSPAYKWAYIIWYENIIFTSYLRVYLPTPPPPPYNITPKSWHDQYFIKTSRVIYICFYHFYHYSYHLSLIMCYKSIWNFFKLFFIPAAS